MKIFTLIIPIVLVISIISCDDPNSEAENEKINFTTFQSSYGGSYREFGNHAIQLSSGNYLAIGTSYAANNSDPDVWLIETDSMGNHVWDTLFVETGNQYGKYIIEDQSGSIYIFDRHLRKMNSNHQIVWVNEFSGGNIAAIDISHNLVAFKDVVISSEYDYSIEVVDTLGNQVEGFYFGTSYPDYQGSFRILDTGDYIVTGTISKGGGDYDVSLMLINSSGQRVWVKEFGDEFENRARDIELMPSGGFAIVGYSNSSGSNDVCLIITDSQGAELSTHYFGEGGSEDGMKIISTLGGGYVILAVSEAIDSNNRDIFMIKTNSEGDEIWTTTFGGIHNDYASGISQTMDGGYIICGSTEVDGPNDSNLLLVKIDPDGNLVGN